MRYFFRVALSLAVLLALAVHLQDRVPEGERRAATGERPVVRKGETGRQSNEAKAGDAGAESRVSNREPAGVNGSGVSSVRRVTGDGISYGRGEPMRQVLDRFWSSDARRLLGFGTESVRLERMRDGSGIRSAHYQWMAAGFPVVNSKISLFFDQDGALVHALVDVPDAGAPRVPAVIHAEAARALARKAYAQWVANRGVSAEGLEIRGVMREAFVASSDGLRPCFFFQEKLPNPLWGELEIVVDASAGGVSSIKDVSRR